MVWREMLKSVVRMVGGIAAQQANVSGGVAVQHIQALRDGSRGLQHEIHMHGVIRKAESCLVALDEPHGQ